MGVKMYKKSELHVQEFGRGREKRFVIYADYEKIEGFGPRWNTVVHPDIDGNKSRAVKQALNWLNRTGDDEVRYPYIQRDMNTKLSLVYSRTNPPTRYYETDDEGCSLETGDSVVYA